MAGLSELDGVTPPEHLFTWVDADEHLALLATADEWPDWLAAADGWWDALELVVAPGTTADQVAQWLEEVFGRGSTAWRDGSLMLRLDDPRTTEFTGLPVVITVEAAPEEPRRVPLLREKHITSHLSQPLARPRTPRFSDDIQILAFHSFKGGCGRTVHAVAAADAAARRGSRVLLIDADLEAPGITWMHRAQGGQCDIAYEDFLALLHGIEGSDYSSAVDIAAAYLPNQQVGQYPGAGSLTLLPVTRRVALKPPSIEPADLLTPGRDPYFLTEALAALAARIGASTVVIDLRAGATELSAPVLLDPRVQRVFVTTLSHQSLVGTEHLVKQLGQRAPALQGQDPASSVVITQFRNDVHREQAERAVQQLSDALSSSLRLPDQNTGQDGATGSIDTQVLSDPVRSPFREELLALPSSWDAVLGVLRNCQIAQALEPLLPAPADTQPRAEGDAEGPDYDELRRRLAETTRRFIYAEKEGLSSASGFLVTDPLRRLLGSHRTEPPIALVVGAKGAGKTFMYAKMCAARTWDRFAQRSGMEDVRISAPIVPVLESTHLEYRDLTPQDLREAFAASHGEGQAMGTGAQAIRDHLTNGLLALDPRDGTAWRRLWLECLMMAAGLSLPEDGSGVEAALAELGRRTKAVFVIDGLEDLMQSLDSEAKRTALRVLLVDVLTWLRSLRGRPLGLVVFVRQDLVRWAVRQNSGQLLARYESFALRWNKEEALRLALWAAAHADALPEPLDESQITEIPYDDLVKKLMQVWGRKMGTEKSKEARSHLWVPAALGDFNDQVQARDVIVFLSEAAQKSIGQASWKDRVLAPSAMRNALLRCSEIKIEAIQSENQEVGDLLKALQQVRQQVTVPFELDEVGLSVSEADFLVDSGVFARGKDGRYFVAEIYRHGLGFGTERRAKVLWHR